jgi:hypothetical protein
MTNETNFTIHNPTENSNAKWGINYMNSRYANLIYFGVYSTSADPSIIEAWNKHISEVVVKDKRWPKIVNGMGWNNGSMITFLSQDDQKFETKDINAMKEVLEDYGFSCSIDATGMLRGLININSWLHSGRCNVIDSDVLKVLDSVFDPDSE